MRFALRQLRHSLGFTVTAVLTLTLAIGADAVVFGIMDGLVLRPLNEPQSKTLYGTQYGDESGFQSYPNYLNLHERAAASMTSRLSIWSLLGWTRAKIPSWLRALQPQGITFDVLGIHPWLGRFFSVSDEYGPNSAPYLVLSYAYWHIR